MHLSRTKEWEKSTSRFISTNNSNTPPLPIAVSGLSGLWTQCNDAVWYIPRQSHPHPYVLVVSSLSHPLVLFSFFFVFFGKGLRNMVTHGPPFHNIQTYSSLGLDVFWGKLYPYWWGISPSDIFSPSSVFNIAVILFFGSRPLRLFFFSLPLCSSDTVRHTNSRNTREEMLLVRSQWMENEGVNPFIHSYVTSVQYTSTHTTSHQKTSETPSSPVSQYSSFSDYTTWALPHASSTVDPTCHVTFLAH